MKKILLIIMLLNCKAIYCKDGDLDKTFNKTGKVSLAIGKLNTAFTTLVQPDKKVLAAGTINSKFAVIRLNNDGSLDTSFANTGKAILQISNTDSLNQAMALQPDGKILLTGASNDKFVVVRLNANGSLDKTFASGGILIFILGYGIDSNAIQVQKNGKIVIAGDSYANRAINVIRLNANGTFDPSFTDGVHGAGKVMIKFALTASCKGLAIQNDGKIVVCGNIAGFFSVLRLQSDGALDLNFGPFGLGYVPIISGKVAGANSVIVQSNGKIVVGGFSDNSFALARLTSDGSLDTSFNGKGFIETSIDKKAVIQSVTIESTDNKILVAGFSVTGPMRYVLARYNPNGTLDKTFGNQGIIFTNFEQTFLGDVANSITFDKSTNKIVVAGYAGKKLAVSRYNAGSIVPLIITSPINGSTINNPVIISGKAPAGVVLNIQVLNKDTGQKFISTLKVPNSGVWALNPLNFSAANYVLTVTSISPRLFATSSFTVINVVNVSSLCCKDKCDNKCKDKCDKNNCESKCEDKCNSKCDKKCDDSCGCNR